MRDRMGLSRGTSFAGRATGQDAEPFMNMVRAKSGYIETAPKSTGKPMVATDGKRIVPVGTYYPDTAVFAKSMPEKNLLRTPPAIAVQESAIEDLARWNCRKMRVRIRETGEILTCSFAHFLEKCFPLDRGYGRQLALQLNEWESSKNPQGSLFSEVTA